MVFVKSYKELTKDNFLTGGEGTPARRGIIKALTKGILEKKYTNSIIKEVFRKGYKIGTKVIRHSMVVVAN